MLIKRVTDFLDKYDLNDKTIIVGFSGGFDSMCLLDILSKIKDKEGYDDLKIIAAHFNHNWRGEESLKEQEVCRMFAASRGFEFYVKQAPENLKKTENDARIARYEFFEDALDIFDADALFTAHNKDDNAETVLYRIIKGTGLVGLQGISVHRGNYYRPLLFTKRSEILDYCEKYNLDPNIDSSNGNVKYKRNFLRLNVIPLMEKINPAVKDTINTLSEIAINENAIIEEYLADIRPKVYDNDRIVSKEYLKLSYPVKMRLLHEYIQSLDLDYDLKKVKEVYDFIEQNITKRNGSTMSIAAARWLYADDKFVDVIPPKKEETSPYNHEEEVLIDGIGEYEFGKTKIVLKKYENSEIFVFPESSSGFAYVDLSDIKFPLTLRTRRDGDIIKPFGMSGTMKLKKYLNSKGINKHDRDNILLVAKDNEIYWAAGVGLSSRIGVAKTPTHVIEAINL